jgi:hypothetical protein
MKIKNIKKAISVTLSERNLNSSSFFLLEIKKLNIKKLVDEPGILYTKTFVKATSKNINLSDFLVPSTLKFPLVLKVFKDYNSIFNYLLEEKKEKKNSIVFVKMGKISFKENDLSLLYSTDIVHSFNSLSHLLNPMVGVLKLFTLSKR